MRNALGLFLVCLGAPFLGCAEGATTGSGGQGGSVGGSGGSGGATVCEPSSTISCYTGPSGTLGVGVCVGGTQTCNAAGTGYGLCEGEVTPTLEQCDTPDDEDCDGSPLNDAAGCICVPDATVDCYSGPGGTKDVGVCKGGAATCSASGKSLGPCTGEVLPQAEDCTTIEDDDCDGSAPTCGIEVWSRGFGDAASQVAKGIRVAASGTSVLTGYLYGTTDFGAAVLASSGGSDAFVAKLDAAGATLWARRFGDGANQDGRAVAIDASGNVAITGLFGGTIDFGGGALTSAGGSDVFVAKLDAAGEHLWSMGFGNNSNQYGSAVAFAPGGDVVIAGAYAGSIDFGGGTFTSAGGSDAFLAVFGSGGVYKWSKSFGNNANQSAAGVVVQPSGNIVVAGSFEGQIDLGSGQLATAGLADVFVGSFGAAGNALWSKRFGSAGQQYAFAVATAADGKLALTGSFAGTIDFGCGPLTSAGGNDLFVAHLDATGGCLWSLGLGDAADQAGNAVTFDTAGNVIVTGAFAGTVKIGNQTLVSAGGTDVLVAKIGPSGLPLWAAKAGGTGDQGGLAVGTDGMNHLYVAGAFAESLGFNAGPLMSAGAEDAFVVKLLP